MKRSIETLMALAGAAWLGATTASAQAPFSCTLQPPAVTFHRAESLTELLPDVVIKCSGGVAGSVTSLTLKLIENTNVTSRIVDASSFSLEALLLINEPAPAERVLGTNAFLGQYPSQGVQFNQVSWAGIQVAQPGSGTLTLRITNVRIDLAFLGVSSTFTTNYSQAAVTLTVDGVNVLTDSFTASGSTFVQFATGLVGRTTNFDIRQCDDSGPGLLTISGSSVLNAGLLAGGPGQIQFNLRFQELIPKGFSNQQNETATTLASAPSVGVGSQGTRLVASFANIPPGMQIYVTTGPVGPASSKGVNAVLVNTDANGAGPFSPVAGTAKGGCGLTGAAQVPLAPVSLSGGSGLAAWEVTSADPFAFEQLSFGIALVGTPPAFFIPTIATALGPVFTSANSHSPSSTLSIPRFAPSTFIPMNIPIAEGLTFVAVEGGGAVPDQLISVGCTGPQASTKSGGSWLSNATVKLNGATLDVGVVPAGLAAGTYFGEIDCSGGGRLTVLLNVVSSNIDPGPIVDPIGLVFTAQQGAAVSDTQNLTITNLTNQPVQYQETNPTSAGTVVPSKPVTIPVQFNTAGLSPGVYSGTIHFAFSDGFQRDVVPRVIVTPASSGQSSARAGSLPLAVSGACVPNSLNATVQSLGPQNIFPTSFPVTITVLLFDDCHNPISSGTVSVTFTSEPTVINLQPQSSPPGSWIGTWTPITPLSSAKMTVTASVTNSGLASGVQTLAVNVTGSGGAPVILAGGVVNAASGHAPGAVGAAISIYGQNLADPDLPSPNTYPLPPNVGSTSVAVAGRRLPLIFASPGLINAILPYDLPPGSYGIQVLRGNAVSSTVQLLIAGASPGVYLMPQGVGAITLIDGSLVTPSNPAKVGDVILIYGTGLGPKAPPVDAGSAAPVKPLSTVVGANSVSVTIGNVTFRPSFSGLTPTIAGSDVVIAVIPAGVPTGDMVPVTVTAGGAISPPVPMAIQ